MNNMTEACGEKKEYFPLFVSSSNKRILVIGAGKIAQRRIETLLKFNFSIDVISIDVTQVLNSLADSGAINLTKKPFEKSDIHNGYDYILVATDSHEVNKAVTEIANGMGIPVNVADCKESCDFFFPGVVLHEDAVIGVTCQGKSHTAAKEIVEKIKSLFTSK